jgi:hypothetical protein
VDQSFSILLIALLMAHSQTAELHFHGWKMEATFTVSDLDKEVSKRPVE